MRPIHQVQLAMVVLVEVAGLLLTGCAAWLVLLSCMATDGRGEYGLGAWWSLFAGFALLLAGAFLAIRAKPTISKQQFRMLTLPALVVGVVLLIWYFCSALLYLVARAT
ncbi:MAG TPA: hypothetical protein VLI06_02520 [Solimonas sp.]|nr:hypothetical protein [Solimonas sp.]